MIPKRSPRHSFCPCCKSQTIRRATNPAICTTANSDPASSILSRIDIRSLYWLALSNEALKNLPGRYARPVTVPLQGERLTWTLNTDIKMASLNRGSSPMPNSGGGTARIMGSNLPSAGLRTRLPPDGTVRSGSRKKTITQIVTGKITRPSHPATKKPSRLSAEAIAINRQPSRWIRSFNGRFLDNGS